MNYHQQIASLEAKKNSVLRQITVLERSDNAKHIVERAWQSVEAYDRQIAELILGA